jgi:hypothetical protein
MFALSVILLTISAVLFENFILLFIANHSLSFSMLILSTVAAVLATIITIAIGHREKIGKINISITCAFSIYMIAANAVVWMDIIVKILK